MQKIISKKMSPKQVRVYRVLSIFSLFCVCSFKSEAQLQEGFYQHSCGMAELIVKEEVHKGYIKDNGVVAGLVRLHFHDCFVRGCDGSVLIDSTPTNKAEKDAPPNNPSIRGLALEVIDNAKSRLEAVCKGVVSCADILAFAARDSIQISGGLAYDVPAGRRDGRVSLASEALANLLPPTFNVDQLTQSFAKKGLTQKEMITLSGAHTLGRSHCTSFSNRLYNFSRNSSRDLTLDPTYATQLMKQCPRGLGPDLVVPMDPSTPYITDVAYYKNVLANRGLFTTDQTLISKPETKAQVVQYARNPDLWARKFAAAMVKMGRIGALTGKHGEVRANCRVINNS